MERRGEPPSRSAVSAGAIGTFLSLLNVLVGFGFQALLAAKLGVDTLADTFQVAWTVVTFAAVVQFTMVTSLFVPALQGLRGGSLEVGRSRMPFALGLLASCGQVSATFLVSDPSLKQLLFASAVSHVFVGLTVVPQSVAFIHRRFWIAGAGPVANGVALLAVTSVGLAQLTASLLGWAITAGYVAQWAITALGIRDLSAVASRDFRLQTRLFLGVLGFTLVSKFQPVLERIVSYQLATGSAAALGYGQKVAQGLLLFASFGIATASAASLARYFHARDVKRSADLLARVTLSTFVFSVLVCALALPAAHLAVAILFERGAFGADDTAYVANIVVIQLPWVIACAVTGVLTSYLYVERRYKQVLVASIAGLVATLGSGLLLSSSSPKYAVAAASSTGAFVSLLVVIAIVRRTRIWNDYRDFVLARSRLLVAGALVLGASVVLTSVASLLHLGNALSQSVVLVILVSGLAAALLICSKSTRLFLKESLSASI